MTTDEFRRLALSLADVRGGTSLGVEEFRINGALLATLGSPEPGRAIVRLSPADQKALVRQAPQTFSPALGGPGARGATRVLLAQVEQTVLLDVLQAACRKARAESEKRLASAKPFKP